MSTGDQGLQWITKALRGLNAGRLEHMHYSYRHMEKWVQGELFAHARSQLAYRERVAMEVPYLSKRGERCDLYIGPIQDREDGWHADGKAGWWIEIKHELWTHHVRRVLSDVKKLRRSLSGRMAGYVVLLVSGWTGYPKTGWHSRGGYSRKTLLSTIKVPADRALTVDLLRNKRGFTDAFVARVF